MCTQLSACRAHGGANASKKGEILCQTDLVVVSEHYSFREVVEEGHLASFVAVEAWVFSASSSGEVEVAARLSYRHRSVERERMNSKRR